MNEESRKQRGNKQAIHPLGGFLRSRVTSPTVLVYSSRDQDKPRCRATLYAAISPRCRIVLGYRVSLDCASRCTVVYDAAPWRYECLEFINGRRANDKSRVRSVSPRGPFYSRVKGEERERSHKGTSSFDELLPCTSRSRLADKSAPVFTRATRLEPRRTGNTR